MENERQDEGSLSVTAAGHVLPLNRILVIYYVVVNSNKPTVDSFYRRAAV